MRIVFISILMVLLSGLTGLSKAGVPEPGILSGLFSVSDCRQVRFSSGNLQYCASTNTWRFAANQWDVVGDGNVNLGETYSGWIDLFGWATSGYNHGAEDYQPWTWSDGDNYYSGNSGWRNKAYGDCGANLNDQTGQADWGYNAISNGGNTTNSWRTLTTEEWRYLLYMRVTDAGIRFAKATVNGVNGLILLPDDWDATYYAFHNPNQKSSAFSDNNITTSQWNVLCQHGAVFLPAAGYRYTTTVYNAGSIGNYWSASGFNCYYSMGMMFSDGDMTPEYYRESSEGLSVRLVRDMPAAFSKTLLPGWNWFSSPLEYDSNSLTMLQEVLAFSCSSAVIKSPSEFVSYGDEVWTGQLHGLDNAQMYLIMVDHQVVSAFSGAWANSQEHPVTLTSGWNWIGFPFKTAMTLKKVFAYFTPSDGDLIKGKSGFSSYDALSDTWMGQLQTLEPGEGYLYLSNNPENVILEFPSWTYGSNYENDHVPHGALNSVFSLSETTKVYFSQGNLQYIGSASTPYWKFADHQWDCLGDNGQGSNSPTVDRDLFGWGTSGHNHGAACYQPWSISENASDYYAYGSDENNLFDQTGQADWGYNFISNGGDTVGVWRTPTSEEWIYVFNSRNTMSGIRYAKARVNGVNGMILLPDDWSPRYYMLGAVNQPRATYEANVISATEWNDAFEKHGAVFLPASGYRLGTTVRNVGTNASYWSSSNEYNNAGAPYYYEYNFFPNDYMPKQYGLPVRLVRLPKGELPQVSTSTVTNITSTEATCGGNVIFGGGLPVTERGVCWSTHPNPTLFDYHSSYGVGEGSFEVQMTIFPSTTYYVRAYATNILGTSYGQEESFTTPSGTGGLPDGAINGLYSVGDGVQVFFSRGNLQYIGSASTPYWKFAENQWDYLGDNVQGGDSETVDRDLFGWGTSGYDHGAMCYQPWSNVSNNYYYGIYGDWNAEYNLYDQTGQADWGYNPISNGGNTPNTWRTPTHEEWDYLFNIRNTDSGIRFAKARVHDVDGVILLPDNWNSSYYPLGNVNQVNAIFNSNVITSTAWTEIEQHGAVFLPAASAPMVFPNGSVASLGNYWSSSCFSNQGAYELWFYDWSLDANHGHGRSFHKSVRLICQ